jgi:hypothetical protein
MDKVAALFVVSNGARFIEQAIRLPLLRAVIKSGFIGPFLVTWQ